MIIPAPLQTGDRVALIAPSSPVLPERLDYAAEWIAGLGYAPEIYPSCTSRAGFLAGEDTVRAADVNHAFADPAIRAIVAVRGGYGGARLADRLDYDIIKANPKIFCGFSDVTVLHLLLNQQCGLVTFHAPMPAAQSFREDLGGQESLAGVLAGHWAGAWENGGAPFDCLCPGTAEGVVTGGNLTVLAATAGTPYQLDCRGKILFLEDVGEKAYAVDRSLRQMKDSGMLNGCRGILLGTWQDCPAPRDMPLREVFRQALEPLGIPVIAGLPCGHSVASVSLPLGMPASVDAAPEGCIVRIHA